MSDIQAYLDKIARGEDTTPEDLDIEYDYITTDSNIYIIPKQTNKPIKIVKENEWLMTLKGYEIELSKKLTCAEAKRLLMSIFDTVDIGVLPNE